MRILLVITNVSGFHEIPYSFGLSSIAASALLEGHEVEVVGIQAESDYQTMLTTIDSFDPSVIGFSAVTSQYQASCDAAKLIRDNGGKQIIVCGGTHITMVPNDLIASPQFDVGFVGESEVSFIEFLRMIETNRDYRGVSNLAYVEDGRLIQNSLTPLVTDLDVLPHPIFGDLFESYIRGNGYAPFLFSRGCPYKCTNCATPILGHISGSKTNRPRYRSPVSCIEEINLAREQHTFERIYITDDIFGVNRKWRREFCELYAKEIRLPYICLLRTNLITEEFLYDLKRSGCYRIQFGVESGNEHIRNSVLKRGLKEDGILQAFKLVKEFDIDSCALNMIGLPGENESMVWDTIRLNRRIEPKISSACVYYPYKGTPLGDYCFENELVDESRYYDTKDRRASALKFSKWYLKKLALYRILWPILVSPRIAKSYYSSLVLLFTDSRFRGLFRRFQKMLRRVLAPQTGPVASDIAWPLPKTFEPTEFGTTEIDDDRQVLVSENRVDIGGD